MGSCLAMASSGMMQRKFMAKRKVPTNAADGKREAPMFLCILLQYLLRDGKRKCEPKLYASSEACFIKR